jgi:hypothetical protein
MPSKYILGNYSKCFTCKVRHKGERSQNKGPHEALVEGESLLFQDIIMFLELEQIQGARCKALDSSAFLAHAQPEQGFLFNFVK